MYGFCYAWQVSVLTSQNEELMKKQIYMTAIDEENVELMQKIDVSEKEIPRDLGFIPGRCPRIPPQSKLLCINISSGG